MTKLPSRPGHILTDYKRVIAEPIKNLLLNILVFPFDTYIKYKEQDNININLGCLKYERFANTKMTDVSIALENLW